MKNYAFFDLDGTLIKIKSMMSFLEYCCARKLVAHEFHAALSLLERHYKVVHPESSLILPIIGFIGVVGGMTSWRQGLVGLIPWISVTSSIQMFLNACAVIRSMGMRR